MDEKTIVFQGEYVSPTEIQRLMKLFSYIKEGDKFDTANYKIISSIFDNIQRIVSGDQDREKLYLFIEELFGSILSIFDQHPEFNNDILELTKDFKRGVVNIRITYIKDKTYVSKIDVLIMKIDRLIMERSSFIVEK